jgi:hypothetical protein
MTATTFSHPSTHPSSRPSSSAATVLRAALLVLALVAVAVVAFVIGRVTQSDGVHIVRQITGSDYLPEVCRLGRPC